ncbi:hypothetical protein K438DRAFT_1782883 [Mycena galopus ATCC 62051]|nr:hypothetical protein K438DRAFT_1782883 [Mycena galopus ATCC 62051]
MLFYCLEPLEEEWKETNLKFFYILLLACPKLALIFGFFQPCRQNKLVIQWSLPTRRQSSCSTFYDQAQHSIGIDEWVLGSSVERAFAWKEGVGGGIDVGVIMWLLYEKYLCLESCGLASNARCRSTMALAINHSEKDDGDVQNMAAKERDDDGSPMGGKYKVLTVEALIVVEHKPSHTTSHATPARLTKFKLR